MFMSTYLLEWDNMEEYDMMAFPHLDILCICHTLEMLIQIIYGQVHNEIID
jgi:hypothetical protein